MRDIIELWWLNFWLRRDRARLVLLEANRRAEIQRVNFEHDREKRLIEGAIQIAESRAASIRYDLAARRATDPHK